MEGIVMKGRDFKLECVLRAAPETVYRAAATQEGIYGWWTRFTEWDGALGSVATMRFPEAGFHARMEVLALDPNRRVHWRCIEARHPPGISSDPEDWVGTEILFEIEPVDDERTRLTFTHVGLTPLECSDVCTSTWEFYIDTSLRKLVEEGRGEPATK